MGKKGNEKLPFLKAIHCKCIGPFCGGFTVVKGKKYWEREYCHNSPNYPE